MVGGVLAHRVDMLRGGRITLEVSQIVFSHIAGEERRLGGEQEKSTQDGFFGICKLESEGGLARIEVGNEFFREGDFGLRLFVAAAGGFLVSLGAFFYRGQIGQDEFRVDHLDVPDGIDRSRDMVDVRTLETPNDLDDGIDLPDVAQKLVPEALALARAGYQPRDVHELDRRREDFLGLRHRGEFLQPVVGHIHDADIRLDRAEREIRRLRLAGAGHGIEESGLPDIRQSDDSGFQHRGGRLAARPRKEKSSFARATRLY
jgi:hypothetical protein